MKISFVTTIYRTADDIEPFAERAAEAARRLGFDHEVVFVNDGSPDNGAAVAVALAERDPSVVVVDLSRNFGQHKALWTGLGIATGDLVMMMDGDLEEDPLWAVDFHQAMVRERADVVYGVQVRPKGNPLYQMCRNAFYSLLGFLSDLDFPRDVTTARLMSRRYIDALLTFDEREIFLVGVMHVTGFRQVPLPVRKEALAPTKYTLRKLLRLFLMAVTAFSIAPLIGVFLTGLAISAGSVLLIAFLVLRYFITGIGVPGWTSVMIGLLLFSGLSMFINGVIAIYIGTIFLEVKRRPRTIITAIHRSTAPPSTVSPANALEDASP
ncbi:glycosyltransferase family 2 protein [Azospirillum brasilense]|uniref:glycosyltransferase family 2 protein n=1 Tax=Azospirillum brasilense TaxID=192 RepID=UPI001EDA188B|nr:glycosyltransferase family 2 protein [Azospirillum brasilense]UKJ78096.1 glycosyltransferase family 2 protein [Azospirillum brasilense]